ncbi:bifunctional folate synthesis protein [Neokomagataea thailandica NBRC 106555]|uniref:Bifunctional folate synthesis protein n=2 Tax=Neokomagataea TaxID=1223423 RepID=A0A4Y6V8U7_9PROT|nr:MULTISPECIES: 2-amino-4-hydroxy-6-hydroxymethyldihydropteridine diphosphokinase [Neokomagataea]QDH25090.1 2-amino-4-hydroxy-6-hydroxymethyldihydropteridine diphosphokinase [Neokomagataea tanensis]GBR54192.1 bifunctional folate synthesis protein [Neokomagataea thailandica NBRC 106555]
MIEPPLTCVEVRDLCLFGYHGVLPEENRLGQRFVVDIAIKADLSQAQRNDSYSDAVCYGSLCDIASAVVTGPPLALIETVAARIAETILERFAAVEWVRVCVRKPSVPVTYALSETSATVEHVRHYEVAFSLGANLGEREATLSAAVDWLSVAEGLEILAVSSLFDSAPWGGVDQPGFVNLCVTGRTTLRPHALLRLCKETERALGRQTGRRWGERAVDIDILYYGDLEMEDRVLTLPHKHMFERAFVLEPLAEIVPERLMSGRSVKDALAVLSRSPEDVVRRKV